MSYEGGYTSAVNSQSRRAFEDAETRRRMQETEQIGILFQQSQAEQREQKALAPKVLELFAEMQMPPPPQDKGPQAPPPGQPSVPMQMPQQVPPQGLGSAMAPMQLTPPPAAGAPPGTAPPMPQGAGPGAPMPPGPPQGAAPAPPGMAMPPPGGAPAGGPPAQSMPPPQGWQAMPRPMPAAGGAPPGAGGLPPPPSQDEHAYTGGKGFLPPAMASPEKFIETMKKANIPPEQRYQALKMVMPLIDKQNKQLLDEAKLELNIAQAMVRAQHQELAKWKAEKASEQKDRALGQVDKKIEQQQPVLDARVKKLTGAGAGAGGPAASAVKPETIDYYARQSLAGDNSWQVGLARGKVGQQLIAAVKDRIPELAKEGGVSPEEASAAKGTRDSLNSALRDRQKFVSASNQFVTNFEKQADIVDKYLKPGAAGATPIINKWIQAGRKQIAGDPDVTALDIAVRGLAREHQRIVTGVTSNAQLHVSAQETADQLLNIAQTPEQVKAALKVMREEAKNAREAGLGEVDFLREQLKHLGAGARPGAGSPKPGGSASATNAKGWKLMKDKAGNQAYVSPDGKQFEEVK